MLENNYLAVVMFQLKLKIVCNYRQDYIIVDEEYRNQMKRSIEIIKTMQPDITIFPEMAYKQEYDQDFKELSKNDRLIVFGSTYTKHLNQTQIYFNGKRIEITKKFPCSREPMIRFCEHLGVNDFLKYHLTEHEFIVKGQKFYVLNCLEYYQSAYYIARDSILSKNLFGFVVPCSNSNPIVFMEESKAIHNHNEKIYSFVCNRIKNDGTSGYGKSYIFGPIQVHEKKWLKEEGIFSDEHKSNILTLNSSTPSYVYGKYAIPNSISRFGRSDAYISTPIQITIQNLL